MKLEVQPRDDHQVKIVAEFDQAEFDSYVHRAARKLASQTRIPGFRPGKAPFDMICRVVGDETINQQAIEDLVDDQYSKVLDEANIKPGAAGSLDEIIAVSPPKLAFLVPLEPEVELGDYKSLRKDYEAQAVTDADVDEFLKRMQTNYSTAEPVDRPAENGDLVYVKFSGRLTNPAEGEEAEVYPERPAQFIIGDEVIQDRNWPFPGFNEQLLGVKADDTKKIVYSFPEDEEDVAIRGKEVEFEITVQSVKALTLPEIDDDFAQMVGQFENADVLRQAVREQLEASKRDEYDDTYFTGLIDQIVETATIKYPPQTLDHEIEHLLEHLKEDVGRQGIELDAYFKMVNKDRETFIAEEIKPSAEKRIARSLVLDKLAQTENIQLGEDDYKLAIDETVQTLQTIPQQKSKKNRLDRSTVDSLTMNALNRRYNQLVLNRLKAIATGEAEKAEAPVETTSAADEAPAKPTKARKPRKKAATDTQAEETPKPEAE